MVLSFPPSQFFTYQIDVFRAGRTGEVRALSLRVLSGPQRPLACSMQDDLIALVRSYGTHTPPSQLHWPRGPFDEIQDFLNTHILTSTHFVTYPPSDAYQRAFWKWIVTNIEGADEEVLEAIYTRYLELLSKMRS